MIFTGEIHGLLQLFPTNPSHPHRVLGAGLMVKQGGAMRVDKESTLALLVLTVPWRSEGRKIIVTKGRGKWVILPL